MRSYDSVISSNWSLICGRMCVCVWRSQYRSAACGAHCFGPLHARRRSPLTSDNSDIVATSWFCNRSISRLCLRVDMGVDGASISSSMSCDHKAHSIRNNTSAVATCCPPPPVPACSYRDGASKVFAPGLKDLAMHHHLRSKGTGKRWRRAGAGTRS